MQPVLIHHEIHKNHFIHLVLFTIFYRNRTNNLSIMKYIIFILIIVCMLSCKKESHAYKISYNVSPTHYISGTKILVIATHYNVYCEHLTLDEETCLLNQDSQAVIQNNPEAFNFKIEYLGTDSDFSNPIRFTCQ